MHCCPQSEVFLAAAGRGWAGSGGGGFHWTELYLGMLLALLAAAALAALLWARRQRQIRRDRARTAENLRFSADATWLKHLIGEVRSTPKRSIGRRTLLRFVAAASRCSSCPASACTALQSSKTRPGASSAGSGSAESGSAESGRAGGRPPCGGSSADEGGSGPSKQP
jgi:hypothetical protein